VESESFGNGAIYNALLHRAQAHLPTRLIVAGREAAEAGNHTERAHLKHLADLGVEIREGNAGSGDLDEKLVVTASDAWVGSANATQRGWLGPNSELILRLSVDSEVADGLNAFINSETYHVYEDLLKPVDPNHDEERLEAAQNSLAASWNLRQEIEGNIYWLHGDHDPHDVADDMEIRVGRMGGALEAWPRGSLSLPLPPAAPGGITEFVVISLRLGEKERRWIQVAQIVGFNAEGRDKMLMAQYLDVRTFLSWVRSLLEDSIAGDGGGDWNESGKHTASTQKRSDVSGWVPTLEQALKAWVRDRNQLQVADRAVARYLDTIRERQEDTLSAEELQAVDAVRKVWPVIRRELVLDRRDTGRSK